MDNHIWMCFLAKQTGCTQTSGLLKNCFNGPSEWKHCRCQIALRLHNRMRCWPVKWAMPESAGGNGNTQSCRVLLKTGPCAFHKVLRSGIGNIDRSICASHPNKDGGLQTYCGNSSNTCIKATVEESYMCFPRCQLWSICMAICGTWQGCQQPYPKKCPTPWKATSREFSPNLEQFTQERKLLAGPKLLDQAVLPKALWETAFYDVQSEYLVLPWIPLRARYLTEAWNDDWNHQFWVTKTDSCTVCTCNQKGVELQALPSTGCAHLPSLPHPKLQKGRKQTLWAPVVNAANGFGFLEGHPLIWWLKLVALRRRLRCRYMGICGEPEEQTGKFGYRTLEFCLVLSPIKKKKNTQTLLVILDMSSCKSFRAKVRLTCNEQAEVLTFSALLFKTPALQTFCGGSWKTVSKP